MDEGWESWRHESVFMLSVRGTSIGAYPVDFIGNNIAVWYRTFVPGEA